jgi:hypothetical protein
MVGAPVTLITSVRREVLLLEGLVAVLASGEAAELSVAGMAGALFGAASELSAPKSATPPTTSSTRTMTTASTAISTRE